MTECAAERFDKERLHTPGCEHTIKCVGCGEYLLKARSRFPLGSSKLKLCVICFDLGFYRIERDSLADIDWKAIEADFYEGRKSYEKQHKK